MRKRSLTIGCLIAFFGLYSTVTWAASGQSLHFTPAAPGGDVGVHLKAIGFPPVSSTVNLLGDATDDNAPAATNKNEVARKAALALCSAILAQGITCGGFNCADPGLAFTFTFTCTGGIHDETFTVTQPTGFDSLLVGTGLGNVANLNCDNKNHYPDVRYDLPDSGKVLLQVRPNGILGTVQVKIHHNQTGANPKIASFTITSGNVGDSQAIHNGIRDAINALSFSPDIVAVTHPPSDNASPLTYFPETFCSASAPNLYFVEITNARSTPELVTDVELSGVAGQGLTVEGTENLADIPALGSWGIVVVVAMLLLSGYWLMRRRKETATA